MAKIPRKKKAHRRKKPGAVSPEKIETIFSLESQDALNEESVSELILAEALPQLPAPEQRPPLLDEILRLREALGCLSRGECERILELTADIGRKSPAAPWRLLFKGLVAYYRGEDDKAKAALSRLSPGSAPARFAEPCLFLLNEPRTRAANADSEAFLTRVCRFAGLDPDLVKNLPAAEIYWRRGRRLQSLKKILPSLNHRDGESQVRADLLRFYGNSVLNFSENEQKRYFDLLLQINKSPKTPALSFFYPQIVGLYYEGCEGLEENAVECWEDVIKILRRNNRLKPEVEFAINQRQGDIISDILHYTDSRSSDVVGKMLTGQIDAGPLEPEPVEKAEKFYQRAIQVQTDNIEAYRRLLLVYRRNKDKSAANRLLDQMVERFPEHAETIKMAGINCLRRQAYVKGLKYLHRAADLNPADRSLARELLAGCFNYAVKLTHSHAHEKINRLMTEHRPYCRATQPPDFYLSPATFLARWAVFCLCCGEEEAAADLLARAEKADTGMADAEILYFFRLYAAIYCLLPKKKFFKEIDGRLKNVFRRPPQSSADFFTACIRIWSYMARINPDELFLHEERPRLLKALNQTIREQEPMTAGQFLESARFMLAGKRPETKTATACLQEGEKQHPDNLEISFELLQLEIAGSLPDPVFLRRLREFIKQAAAAGWARLQRQAEVLLEDYEIKVKISQAINAIENNKDFYFDDDDPDDDDLYEIIEVPLPLPPGVKKAPRGWPTKTVRVPKKRNG
ncbi:MAG: hypothetical protein JXR89_09985 [Deltaproteobacteria bacterium]|nr:hypothetical protein [Deltaproteobacteria bacterium]